MIVWAMACPLLLLGCRTDDLPVHPTPLPRLPHREAPARISRIGAARSLLAGPMSTGRRGDFRLENNQLALVVAGIGRRLGGALLDACLLEDGRDSLRSLAPVVGRGRLRSPRFHRLETEELGGTVTLRVEGVKV